MKAQIYNILEAINTNAVGNEAWGLINANVMGLLNLVDYFGAKNHDRETAYVTGKYLYLYRYEMDDFCGMNLEPKYTFQYDGCRPGEWIELYEI